ncbi:MAG: ABC transporter ATP-binding protein [Actinobacteria bacterium]|nr:ABC transporter ATP-binding protein [Actinomycetota bacterium]
MGNETLAVQLAGIEKRFPGVIANHDVNLNVRARTIHAIVGENGAGKSTLMKTLYGMHQPEAGTISVFDQPITFRSPSDAIAAGIGMVHQHFMLADNLTVLENIVLGAEPVAGGVIKYDDARRTLQAIMAQSGTHVDLEATVSDLGVGQRQRVEILKVLFRGAKILILDEPTAVLVPQEVEELFGNLHRLVADGATIIFISHKLDEVLTVSDDITVIRAGTTVAEVKPADVTRGQLAELMVGSELPSPHGRTTEVGTEVQLEVKSLTVTGPGHKPLVDDVSFVIRRGEVLGVAGVEGNGQFELCEAILGQVKPSAGSVHIGGADVTGASAHDRLVNGLSYIPFDRHREGLLLEFPLWENTLLGRDANPEFLKGPFIDGAATRADCRDIIEQFDVRPPSEVVPAYALSGGNQQKLLVGRELSSDPQVLIAAHPTRGVDIGAQAAIWDKLRVARDQGLAVLLISADLEELIGLSDNIVVMFDGRINARLTPGDATPELLGTYMTGGLQEVAS